jgi:tetratricopeptide (TPR) repeat protein
MNRVYVAASNQDDARVDEEYGRLLATPTYPSFSDRYRFVYVQLSWERLGGASDTGRLQEEAWLLPETNFHSSLLKAMALGKMGERSEASRLFVHAQSFSTHLPLSYYRYGQHLLEKGDYRGAVMQLYMAALNAPDPDRAEFSSDHRDKTASFLSDVYLYIGQAYVAQSELETARDYFGKSLALDINDPRAIKGMADTYFLQGDLDRAAEYIDWGRTRFPGDAAWVIASQAIEDSR